MPAVVLVSLLAGCHVPGGTVTRNFTVEFDTINSAAAQKVVIADCGHLPGVTDSPVAQGDPNVILDYSHASTPQFEALSACLNNLLAHQPKLQIRDVEDNDGTDT
jgi:hypothetical protein